MTALYVVLIIWGILLLLSLVRVGARVEYSESGLFVRLTVGVFSIQVFPVKPKKKKAEQPRKENPPNAAPKQKKGGNFELIKECLPLVADAAGGLRRRISIDEFQMDLLWSAPDPAACAMGFGAANGAVGMIWPVIVQNFHVKHHRIRTAVDFEQGKPTVYLVTQMTMRIGQLVSFALRLAVRFFRIYRSVKKKQKLKQGIQQKEAV